MREKIVQTLGAPGTFDITDKDNPLYYIARYAHECSLNLYHLNAQSFQWEQPTEAETSSALTSLNTFGAAVATWAATAVADSEAGDPIEALPTLPVLPIFTGPNAIIMNLLQVFIRIGLAWLRQKLDSDTDTSEIAQVLERCFLGKTAGGDEYQIIQQLANQPLEINIRDGGGYEDIIYSDREI